MAKLKLSDLKKLVKMTAEEAIDYSINKGVEIADDYDDTVELINEQADVLGGNAKLRLLQLLLDIVDESETMEQVQNNFSDKTESGGWLTNDASVAQLTVVQGGYNSFADSRSEAQKEYKYGLYSAVIDGATTAGCIELNKKVFYFSDKNFTKYIYPPRHFRCRSIVVAFKNYTGKVSQGNQFQKYYSEKMFQKDTQIYAFTPNAKDFDTALFKAFEHRKNKK